MQTCNAQHVFVTKCWQKRLRRYVQQHVDRMNATQHTFSLLCCVAAVALLMLLLCVVRNIFGSMVSELVCNNVGIRTQTMSNKRFNMMHKNKDPTRIQLQYTLTNGTRWTDARNDTRHHAMPNTRLLQLTELLNIVLHLTEIYFHVPHLTNHD